MLNKKTIHIYIGFLDRMMLPLILKFNTLKIFSTIIVSNMISLSAGSKKIQTQSCDLNKLRCRNSTEM